MGTILLTLACVSFVFLNGPLLIKEFSLTD